MRINHNIVALNNYRQLSNANIAQSKSMEKLSSGLRINRAGDDAAGLAISEKMRGQIRGLNQATRNIQDGISLVQTAEGGLNEIHSLLQRGRELSVQAANGTLTESDKKSIQDEINQISSEIDRISTNTEFNTIKVLNVDSAGNNDEEIINALKTSWLQAAEKLVKDAYGIEADGSNINIKIVSAAEIGSSTTIAAVSYNVDADGKATNVSLLINRDASSFNPPNLPNGGSAPMYADRVIAHEMVHAIMGRTMNYGPMSKWFKEGAAEFIHGADERLKIDIKANGGGTTGLDVIMNKLDPDNPSAWASDSESYSAAYVAVRYLHQHLKDAGQSDGIKAVFNYLNTNQSATLSDALQALDSTTFNTADAEEKLFQMIKDDYNLDKASFLENHAKINLDADNAPEVDVGAIGGLDADGGGAKTAESIVEDLNNLTNDPLQGFTEIWPNLSAANASNNGITIQVAANQGQSMNVALHKVDSQSIGIGSVDVVADAENAIERYDVAIQTVSSYRSELGAVQNRLEHALSVNQNTAENLTSAESRIRDVDMAKGMMEQTKNSILSQVAQAMLAQSNQLPQGVLQLLR